VFPWQSRHHWATVGLQRDDFTLAGLADTDLIVTSGLDSAEAPDQRWRLADSVDIPPAALGAVAALWRTPGRVREMPPLRHKLAVVTQRGWLESYAPSQVTRGYQDVVTSRGGFVAADAGIAGYWVARTLGTTTLDTVVVPSRPEPEGFAVACAVIARMYAPERPVLAVTDGPLSPRTCELLTYGRAVAVEVWEPDGIRIGPERHRARLADAVYGESATVLSLATDGGQLDEMIEVAGPVVAWR
jgi:hypothetical protein